jgi:hypothetical protein
MTCPFCGHALNFLTEVLALTQTGTQCPNCWNHLPQGRGIPANPSQRTPAARKVKTPVHSLADEKRRPFK